MRAWDAPELPTLPGRSLAPVVYDSATASLMPAEASDGLATLYVCGITPYDATHLGHAATYLAFDTLQRVWRDAGFRVRYAQNATDVDDPLLERATRDGIDWRELAADQIELFRTDMAALRILPPDSYIAVTEVVDRISGAVAELLALGVAYRVPAPDASPDSEGFDVYFDNTAAADVSPWTLGDESRLSRAEMLPLFAERGGDPDRAGKRDALDALLWRAARDGEPSWPSPVGAGRPGWHIECAVIALDELGGGTITVQAGGSDLIFPHHDLSAGHAAVLSGEPAARVYAHGGMVAYQGEKMSKSLGNLVKVSELRAAGVDPRAVRLAILAHHYRDDWEWTDGVLVAAQQRLALWADAASAGASSDAVTTSEASGAADPVVQALRDALHEDLGTPTALAAVDDAVRVGALTPQSVAAIDLLLGIRL